MKQRYIDKFKFMARCILALFLFFGQFEIMAQGTWEKKDLPTIQFLRSVFFTDSLYGWIAGDSGIILHTADGGNSWVAQNSHTDNEITDIFFLNRNLGWAAALNYMAPPYGTILLKTDNGGATWLPQNYPEENIFITCILFRDSLNGWMGGRPHAIVKTIDGGVTWNQATVDTSILAFFPVLTIQFYNDQYGYASGGMFDIAGVIWRTSNGGDTWFAIDPSDAPADEVHALHIFDSITVMGAGGDPDFGYGVGMIRTFDGGINWEYNELDIQGNATDLDFRNATEAWAPLGPQRKMIYSLDAGNTWAPIFPPDSVSIYDVTFPDSQHGYAVGRDGACLKYHPPVIPSAPQNQVNDLVNYLLFQNTPNPVQNNTTIRFRIPAANPYIQGFADNGEVKIQIRLFDSFGKIVFQSQEQCLITGTHEMNFDLRKLSNGVYFYRLYVNDYLVSPAGVKRLIIAR